MVQGLLYTPLSKKGTGNEAWEKDVTPVDLDTAPTQVTDGVECAKKGVAFVELRPEAVVASQVRFYTLAPGASDWTEDTDSLKAITADQKVYRFDIRGSARFAVAVTSLVGTSLLRKITLA